jgi:hypothetical protein
VLLQGNLKEFSLPNVFQLVKMSAKTGALNISREGETGRIFFKAGLIYFAFCQPSTMPLGERLVKSGHITSKQLKQALAEQAETKRKGKIGQLLLEHGYIDRPTLESAVRAQIEDATFNFFGWNDGKFDFDADETVDDEDILVEMNVESVIMEGVRRLDEWELIFQELGSLERVPHLRYNDIVEEDGGVRITPDQWRVICWMDGRHDINTIVKECGLDRFHGAKVIYELFKAGLLTVGEALLDDLRKGHSVIVRGPIDVYNQIFITTLGENNVTEHLRIEMIDDKEVEVAILAATYAATEANQDASAGDETVVFTAAVSAPEEAWRRLVGQSAALIVLANANSVDSLKASVRDLTHVRKLGDAPIVVATYVSMDEDSLDAAAVVKTLSLADKIPVLQCDLRDRSSVVEILERALDLIVDKDDD